VGPWKLMEREGTGISVSRSAIEGFLLKACLLLTSIFFALLVGEAWLRFRIGAWPFQKEMASYPHLSSRDRYLRWRFSPEGGRNSLGLENREVGPKAPNVLRILFLGDSLIQTGETSSGELYTQVIERNLNTRSSNRIMEVINAGVIGYTTYQELEFLKVYGLEMAPDVVVLGFVFNDVHYKYLHRPTEGNLLTVDPDAILHRFDTRSLPGSLFAHSHLAHKIYRSIEVLVQRMRGDHVLPFEYTMDYLAWKPYAWDKTEELIGELHDLLQDREIQLLVMIFPIVDQVNPHYRTIAGDYLLYPQGRISDICKRRRIPHLDLTETLYRGGKTELFRDYVHLNARGNDIVAAELTDFLSQQLSYQQKAPATDVAAGALP
jgi:lysophospholipase L1-like esterase